MKDNLQTSPCFRFGVFGAEDRSFKLNEVLASKSQFSNIDELRGPLCAYLNYRYSIGTA